jgi:hypothetical protein
MTWRGISPSKSALPPAVAAWVPIATKWQMAKHTAAHMTVDLDREVEAKFRRSSKIRDLGAIGPSSELSRFHCGSGTGRQPRIKSQSEKRIP